MIWLAGLCAYINFLLTNYCLEFGLAGVAISIINTSAAIQVALSSIFLHQLISTGQIIGIILALIGATILASLFKGLVLVLNFIDTLSSCTIKELEHMPGCVIVD